MISRIKKRQESTDRKVYVFCAGERGRKVVCEFKDNGVSVSGFIDNDTNKQGTLLDGTEIVGLEDIADDAIVVISNTSDQVQKEIREQLYGRVKTEDIYTLEQVYTRIDCNNAPLCFPSVHKTDVSICLTVYNGWVYTYNCIESFLKKKTHVPYEFIVGDNCSNDMTSQMERVIKGAKIIHRNNDVGYLRNVNETVKAASSEYVLVLQNDTLFIEDYWLDKLLDYMESNGECSVISPYIYCYDRVNGAGGWRLSDDGSITGFSSRLSCKPYSVAYVQPAAVLIRKSVWDDLEGFDESYSPAWCEDLDLYIRILKRGYDIVMHPDAGYVHYGSKTCIVQNDIYYEHYRILKNRYAGEFGALQKMIDDRNASRGIVLE